MTLERFGATGGPYVDAVRAGRLVFVSGQVAYRPGGAISGVGDIEIQAVQVMENLRASLRAAGAELEHVTKVTIFLVNMEHRATVARVRERYFNGFYPASTLVQVAALVHPDLLLEIEATAVVE